MASDIHWMWLWMWLWMGLAIKGWATLRIRNKVEFIKQKRTEQNSTEQNNCPLWGGLITRKLCGATAKLPAIKVEHFKTHTKYKMYCALYGEGEFNLPSKFAHILQGYHSQWGTIFDLSLIRLDSCLRSMAFVLRVSHIGFLLFLLLPYCALTRRKGSLLHARGSIALQILILYIMMQYCMISYIFNMMSHFDCHWAKLFILKLLLKSKLLFIQKPSFWPIVSTAALCYSGANLMKFYMLTIYKRKSSM